MHGFDDELLFRYVAPTLTTEGLLHLGKEHSNAGRYEAAFKCFDRAALFSPDSGAVQLSRAGVLTRMERFYEAYQAAEKALANGADREAALFMYGLARSHFLNLNDIV